MSGVPRKNVSKGGNRFDNLSPEEYEEIKQAFELFDTNSTGRINPQELKQAMQSLGFDSRNPTIYDMICELDTPEHQKKGGIDIETFVGAINKKLGDSFIQLFSLPVT
jgi:Ca2+-binding EF-hand superfamily protein